MACGDRQAGQEETAMRRYVTPLTWIALALVSGACNIATIAETAPAPSPATAQATAIPPSPLSTPTSTPSPVPEATLSEWETVQLQVMRFRTRLSSDSDGFAGLALALEQPEANDTWCGGLNAAISQFDYARDTASADALTALKDSQGCP
jgi:hypothetical protein